MNPPQKVSDPTSGTFPIGGAEGGGIGGGDITLLSAKVSVQSSAAGPKSFALPEFESWAAEARGTLSKHPNMEIPFVLFRNSDGELDYSTFRSLRAWLKRLHGNAGAKPVLMAAESAPDISPLDPEAHALALGAVDYFLHGKILTENISALLHRLYLLGAVSSSDAWAFAKLSEVAEVSDPGGKHEFAWAIIKQFGDSKLAGQALDLYVAAKKVLKQ